MGETYCVTDFVHFQVVTFRVAQKAGKLFSSFLYALITSNIGQFSNLFHYRNQENICNNAVTKDPTTPQVCRYTTLRNVSVLKGTTGNEMISVTTHFKRLTTVKQRVY